MKVEKIIVEKFLKIAKKSLDYDEMCHCDVCEELNKVEECLTELIRLSEIGRYTEMAFEKGEGQTDMVINYVSVDDVLVRCDAQIYTVNELIAWGKELEDKSNEIRDFKPA